MRNENLMDRFHGNPKSGADQHHRDAEGGDWFGFAVAVRMFGIRWRRRDDNAAPNHQGTKYVGERFDAVGDQRLRVAEDAAERFESGQQRVGAQPEQGRMDAALLSVSIHSEPVIANRRKVKTGRLDYWRLRTMLSGQAAP